MSDPRQATAEAAGPRSPRTARVLGWTVSVLVWVIASDARPLLALLSVLAAAVIRGTYVITMGFELGRSVFWSSWFFVVAALCELAWLAFRSFHP